MPILDFLDTYQNALKILRDGGVAPSEHIPWTAIELGLAPNVLCPGSVTLKTQPSGQHVALVEINESHFYEGDQLEQTDYLAMLLASAVYWIRKGERPYLDSTRLRPDFVSFLKQLGVAPVLSWSYRARVRALDFHYEGIAEPRGSLLFDTREVCWYCDKKVGYSENKQPNLHDNCNASLLQARAEQIARARLQ